MQLSSSRVNFLWSLGFASLAGCAGSSSTLPQLISTSNVQKPNLQKNIATTNLPSSFVSNPAGNAVGELDANGNLISSVIWGKDFARFSFPNEEPLIVDLNQNASPDNWWQLSNGFSYALVQPDSSGTSYIGYVASKGKIVQTVTVTAEQVVVQDSSGNVMTAPTSGPPLQSTTWTGGDDFHGAAGDYPSGIGYIPSVSCPQYGGPGSGSCPPPNGNIEPLMYINQAINIVGNEGGFYISSQCKEAVLQEYALALLVTLAAAGYVLACAETLILCAAFRPTFVVLTTLFAKARQAAEIACD